MGSFLNEFCTEFSQDELELLQDEARTEYFFNEEDYDLLIDMAENAVYTYLYAELTDVKEDIFKALKAITEGKSTISESIGSIEGKVSEELEKIK